MRIAVAGATGVVGHHVTEVVRARGHEVVDTTSTTTQGRAGAERFFDSVTSTLLAAETAAGTSHHVAISIVGIDDIALGYYQGKLRQEQLITGGPVPWSILRTTQFHEFSAQSLGFMKLGPVSLVPAMPSRTIAAAEAAAALVDLCEGGPAGRVPDLAGPEDNHMVDLARQYVRWTGSHQKVVGLRIPGAAGRAIRAGGLRATADGPRGTQTFGQWLHTL